MKVLVISAHPDDETLGCGGALLKHRAAGDSVHWLVVTRAFTPQWTEDAIRNKAAEVDAVAAAYGVEGYSCLGHPTTRLDVIPQAELIAGIREFAHEVRPDWVYLVNRSDVHSDHRQVFDATAAVFKPFNHALGVRRLMSYEVLSSTEAMPPLAERAFMPNAYADISAYIERKLEILQLYRSEVPPDPHPRGPSAVRALARLRGATIGVEYAEGFMVLRDLF